jgi:hypothetical protein
MFNKKLKTCKNLKKDEKGFEPLISKIAVFKTVAFNHSATRPARIAGIEPTTMILETNILPLNYILG